MQILTQKHAPIHRDTKKETHTHTQRHTHAYIERNVRERQCVIMTEKTGKTETVAHIYRVKLREDKIETEKLREVHTKKWNDRYTKRDTQRESKEKS